MSRNYYETILSSQARTEQLLQEAERARLVYEARKNVQVKPQRSQNWKQLFLFNWAWSGSTNK